MKRLLTLLSLLVFAFGSYAQQIFVGDLTYSVLSVSTTDATVKLTSGSKATGDVLIPATIIADNIEFRVTEIGYGAFSGNTNITSIAGTSITEIGGTAFRNCSALKSVSFPAVTHISSDAFRSCSALTSIYFPKLTSTDSFVFASCSSLTSIAFPAATSIGTYTFQSCSALTSANLPAVTRIGDYAFSRCTSLTSVSIPRVVSIDNSAFQDCTNINSIGIGSIEQWFNVSFRSHPLSITTQPVDLYIGESEVPATSIEIPNTITEIPNYAFRRTTITSVSAPTVVSIGSDAFYSCTSLTSAELPKVTSIGGSAFSMCSSLKSANFPEATSVGGYAFWGCSALTSASLPVATSIGDRTFYQCSSLASVEAPSATSVGSYAFFCCFPLTSIDLPVATSIGSYAFNGCTSLKSISFPEVTSVDVYAFYACSALTSIELPAATSLGNYAFQNCSSLTSVALQSVASLGGNGFLNCSNINSLRIGSVEQWCKVNLVNYSGNPLYSGTQPVNLYIGESEVPATSIELPSTVTSIANYAFYRTTITSVSAPAVTSIGVNAFSRCDKLEKCIIGTTTPGTIGDSPFAEFTTIFVPSESVEAYRTAWSNYAKQIVAVSGLEYLVAETTAADGHSELLKAIGGVGKEADVVSLKVVGTINSYDIMLMRNKLTYLRYLDLSDATIVSEKNNHEYYTGYYTQDNVLGAYSFYGINHLRTVVLPNNITSIGSYAFANSGIVEVTGMPDCCTSIGSYAFSNTNNLNTVEIGKGLTTIPDHCFCSSLLPTITLPNNIVSIENEAFSSCANLKELRLPPSMKNIGKKAFSGCESLQEIHVPSMVETIADNAFTECHYKDVYVYTLVPTHILQNSFEYDGVTLHAPQEPESVFWAYYNDTQWSQFTSVLPFEAKYEKWYMSEDNDIVLEDGETIPNENEDEKAKGEMRPGSTLEYKEGAYQNLSNLTMMWTGDKYPSLIDNSNVKVDEITFDLKVEADKWYFFSFPFDIDLSKCKFPSNKYVWRYYNGDIRAKDGSGAWQNVPDGQLRAFEGYIFQTNTNGNIKMVVSDPKFTGSDTSVEITEYPSGQAKDAGWNFVGNPFLSYYNLSNFIDVFDMPITVWDPNNNTYNAIVPGDDDYEFHPFEAFFVQKPVGQNSIDFDKEGREGYNQATRTLKSSCRARAAQAINPTRRIVNLEISNEIHTDRTRVVFNDNKSMGYEAECDAAKFISEESAVQLFTIGTETNATYYAINERPNGDDNVRLGFIIKADGNYRITATRMDRAMALRDNETGAIHNFADGNHEFFAKAGTHLNRFTLIPNQEVTNLNELLAEGIKVETLDGCINIAGLGDKTANIYNASGQLISTLSTSGRKKVAPGIYIVQVGEVATKIVVR